MIQQPVVEFKLNSSVGSAAGRTHPEKYQKKTLTNKRLIRVSKNNIVLVRGPEDQTTSFAETLLSKYETLWRETVTKAEVIFGLRDLKKTEIIPSYYSVVKTS